MRWPNYVRRRLIWRAGHAPEPSIRASGALGADSGAYVSDHGVQVEIVERPRRLTVGDEVPFSAREEAGGTDFAYLPCLNDSMVGIELLRTLVARELEGWVRLP